MRNCKRISHVVLCVLNAVLFLGAVIAGSFVTGQDFNFGEENYTGPLSNYTNDITPTTWAFSIWGLIYFWQAAWIVYSIVNLFRGPQLTFLIPLSFLISFMGSYMSGTAWSYVAELSNKNVTLLPVSAAILWALFGFLVAAMIAITFPLPRKCSQLLENGHRFDPGLMQGLVQNGVGMYAAWCSVAAPLNTATSLSYYHGLPVTVAGTVALAIVAFELVLFIPADLLALDRWTRYLITPHLTLIWALSASLIRNKVTMKRNSVFTLVLLCLVIVATLAKVIVMVWRHRRDPNRYGKFADLESVQSEKNERL